MITPKQVRELLLQATPGPWDHIARKVGQGDYWIAACYSVDDAGIREISNAALIAAAPDIAQAYLELAETVVALNEELRRTQRLLAGRTASRDMLEQQFDRHLVALREALPDAEPDWEPQQLVREVIEILGGRP